MVKFVNETLETNKLPPLISVFNCKSLTVVVVDSPFLLWLFYEENMTADNELDIKEAFQRAQKGHINKAKLVASLRSRYNKVRPVWLCVYWIYLIRKYLKHGRFTPGRWGCCSTPILTTR